MERFPAVIIGGPPNSGKSVLTANLTQTLRNRGVQHYVLRACPDGEGDWTHTADQELVRTILVQRDWTSAFVEHICRDLERRHLPLIVDVGGRPQPWQEAIFDQCTHAILLTRDEASRTAWLGQTAHHGLLLLADLHSDLTGKSRLLETHPILRGTLAGLEWGKRLRHSLFNALTDRLARLFAYEEDELRQTHLSSAPVETVIDLNRLARTLDVPHREEQAIWEPRHLPAVLDYLPEAVPLGLYGRGPNWLYAALALLAVPAPFVQFDVRLGWVEATSLCVGTPDPQAPLQIQLNDLADYVHIEGLLPTAYLDYSQLEALTVPPAPAGRGVVLSGKLPLWLYSSLALTYRAAPWIAVYQPQLGCAAIVYSDDKSHIVGDCIHTAQH
jgi:CRISPR-associated protein Csx3